MNIPQHVAIILDGNGRWAKSKGMPRNYGHARGAKNLEKICRDAYDIGIKYLTVYLFSTENWKRSREEVDGLMKLFRSYTKTCIKTARENNMKVRVLGDPTALADDLQESTENKSVFFARIFEIDSLTRGMRAVFPAKIKKNTKVNSNA